MSSIRRTRRTPSSISWTCGVKYLPDLHRTAVICALYLASVTGAGAIANVAREEIDLVAVQHEIGSVRGMLEPF